MILPIHQEDTMDQYKTLPISVMKVQCIIHQYFTWQAEMYACSLSTLQY